MHGNLIQQLEDRLDDFTPAERKIASFIIMNKNTIPFETANSLADKVNLSAVTVGRFCRSLGYRHFKELKEDLKTDIAGGPWLIGDQLDDFLNRYSDDTQLRGNLETEIASLVEVYKLLETDPWKDVVDLLAKSPFVRIAGFQTERGIAHILTNSLQYVRDNVQLVDIATGHIADVLVTKSDKQVLVIIDFKRYSKLSYLLAESAAKQGIPMIIITDKYCDWARRFTPNVLSVPNESTLFWGSWVGISCLVGLLVNSVSGRLKNQVEPRLKRITDAFEYFVGFVHR